MALPTFGDVFGGFRIFVKIFGQERMSWSSQTFLFNTNYNIDPPTMVTSHFKKYAFLLLTNIFFVFVLRVGFGF